MNLKLFILSLAMIKLNCSSRSASVEITMRNSGSLSFKPDVYGHKIIVERKLTKDGTSSYKIQNAES